MLNVILIGEKRYIWRRFFFSLLHEHINLYMLQNVHGLIESMLHLCENMYRNHFANSLKKWPQNEYILKRNSKDISFMLDIMLDILINMYISSKFMLTYEMLNGC